MVFCSCLTFFVQVSFAPGKASRTKPSPEPRIGHGLVYHDSLRAVLLFGGRDAEGIEHSDLWAWDGRGWTLLDDGTMGGPAPRSRFAMAYDKKRNRLVLQGGGTREQEYGDTWEWDGEYWHLVATVGPGSRSHHAMAYGYDERVILYGGGRNENGSFFDDTWSWNGRRWTKLPVDGPPGRILYAMTSDPIQNNIYVFGGFGDNRTRYNDLWRWDGAMWKRLADSGPEPRISSAMVHLANFQSLFLFGGEMEEQVSGVSWIWDDSQWHKPDTKGPPRSQHAMAYDPVREKIVLFGGLHDGEYQSGVWGWDGTEWMIMDN